MRRVLVKASRRRIRAKKASPDELLLQPWFLPGRIAKAIRSLLPADFRRRLHDVFDDYGCIRCGRTTVPYQSHGMCKRCSNSLTHMINTAASLRSKERLSRRYGKDFVANERSAKRLLRGFASKTSQRPRRRKMVDLGNPLASAFEKFG